MLLSFLFLHYWKKYRFFCIVRINGILLIKSYYIVYHDKPTVDTVFLYSVANNASSFLKLIFAHKLIFRETTNLLFYKSHPSTGTIIHYIYIYNFCQQQKIFIQFSSCFSLFLKLCFWLYISHILNLPLHTEFISASIYIFLGFEWIKDKNL